MDGRGEIASRIGSREGDSGDQRLFDRFADREGSKMSNTVVRSAAVLAIVLLTTFTPPASAQVKIPGISKGNKDDDAKLREKEKAKAEKAGHQSQPNS